MTQAQAKMAGEADAANTNQATLKNTPEVINAGKQAAAAWSSADRANTKGDQLAIFALFQAAHKVSLLANVSNRKGEIEETIMFELKDLAEEPKNSDGSRNNKVITARTNAIAEAIFGIPQEKVDQAFKNRLSRAMQVVFYFLKLEYTPEQVQLTEKNKQTMLKLPYTAMHSPPEADEKGNTDEEALDHFNRLKDSFIVLDGKNGKTVAELQRRANPPKPRNAGANNTNGQADKAQAFTSSVGMVTAVLHDVTDEDKETEIAFNMTNRKQLWELLQLLTAYFEADPMEADELKDDNKNKKTGTK